MNPRFNISYEPTANAHYYLNIAKGFRSGSFNNPDACLLHSLPPPIGGGLPCQVAVDSDELWSYEIGTKLALADGQLVVDAAIYYQDWQDVRQFIPFAGIFQITRSVTPRFTASISVSFTHLPRYPV